MRILKSYYKCQPVGMFEDMTSELIEVTFDFTRFTKGTSLQSIPLIIIFYWTSNIGEMKECIIQGEKQNMIFPNDTYNVIECSCPACCYKIGSQIKFKYIDDYRNIQMGSIEGDLEGQYCENMMSEIDYCEGRNDYKKNYTARNFYFDGSLLNCNQSSCGWKNIVWEFKENASNVIGDHVYMNWNVGDGCSLYAKKSGSRS